MFRLIGAAMLVLASVVSAQGACVVGVRSNDVLNVREFPTTQARIVGVLAPNACGITVTNRCQGRWCVVDSGAVRGWVSMRFIATSPAPAPGGLCVVNVAVNDRLNVRSGPGSGYAIVDTLLPGACGIRRTGPCQGRWCEVATGRSVGWVHMRYVR